MFSKEEIKLAKATVEAIKKISKGKWEWESKPKDICFDRAGNELIVMAVHGRKLWGKIEVARVYENGIGVDNKTIHLDEVIPLLHWERIERILEGMVYDVKEQRENVAQSAQCWIQPTYSHPEATGRDLDNYLKWRRHHALTAFGKTRQLAVMRAVIELGKAKNEK